MTEKRKKNLTLLGVTLGLVAFLGGAVAGIAQNAFAEEETLQAKYAYGHELYIPDYAVDGEEATDYSLLYPSGVLKDGREHTLDEAGKYTVKYEVNGVVETETFVVEKSIVNFAVEGSDWYYGTHEYAPNTPGFVVKVANGDQLKFNQIVDVSKMTKADSLFKFFVTPNSIGQEDVSTIVVRMTDIYDPTNYVDIQIRNVSTTYGAWADRQTYYVVQVGEQPTISGPNVNDLFGWPTYQATTGIDPYGLPIGSNVPWSCTFDYANRDIWCSAYCLYEDWNGIPLGDLDNPDYLDVPWQGFTTGEVYISFYGISYQAPSMNLLITEVAGIDLTKGSFVDEAAPEIKVDFGENEEIPEGLLNKGYKIFDATATDAYDGVRAVETNVYYNYNTRGQVSVYAKDGYFYPTTAGTYTIEYSATDTFGNKGVKTVEVDVKNQADGLDFVIHGQAEFAWAGEAVQVAQSVSVSNERGKYSIKGKATLNGEEYVLNNLGFRPMQAGEYTVNVTVSDYVETVNKTFTLTVNKNDTPVFIDETVFPKYFLSMDKYEIPALGAYDFSDGTAKKLATKVYVSQDGGSETLLNGSLEVTGTQSVVVTYKAEGAKGNAEVSYTIPVVPATTNDGYDVSKNFQKISGSLWINVNNSAVGLATGDGARVRFANPVQAEQFSTAFRWNNEANAFEKTNVYLTDSIDESISVKITYYWKNGNAYFAVNDGMAAKVPKSSSSIGSDVCVLNYKAETKQVYPTLTKKTTVTHTLSGEPFNGFPSNKVYVDYELAEVSGGAELFIQSINNQSICYWDGDFVEPQIFAKRASGDVAKDALVTIYGGRAYDVLSNYVKLTMRVTDPTGNAVTSVDGVALNGSCDPSKDYVIRASYFGEYKVEFTAIDLSGSKKTLRYVFSVVDTAAPTVNVDTTEATASMNETVTVREYTVSDDVTAGDKLVTYVFVMSPSKKLQAVNGTFVVTEKGTYTVYYYCYDEIGNVQIVSYNVVVK